MGGDNVEQLWYGFCLIEALVILFVLTVVVVLCKRFLRYIPWNCGERHSAKHPTVHSFGTLQPARPQPARAGRGVPREVTKWVAEREKIGAQGSDRCEERRDFGN
jgi:hypothetical protein